MQRLLFASACGLVLIAAAACAPGASPVARASLDCPASQGDLTRTSAAPDGRSCLYTTRDGDEVSLRLIPVSGSYQATLAPIEQELQGEIQTDRQTAEAKVKQADENAKAATADAKVASAEAKGAAIAAKQAADDALGEVRAAEAEAKDASDVGATARIDLPGIHVNADENGQADVSVGNLVHINAGENGNTVRMSRDVRLRGEGLQREKRGFRATYIVARDNLKNGWNAVGYEAGGPKTGPITVAVVKARGDHHDIMDDVTRLVRRNGGV